MNPPPAWRYDKGAALSCRDYYIGMVLMHHTYRVRAFKVNQRVSQGGDQVSPVMVLDEMGYNFGVRRGFEYMPVAFQGRSQLIEVLDYAVVNDSDLSCTVSVWMGVEIRRFSVRCPPGMGHALKYTGAHHISQMRLENIYLTGRLFHSQAFVCSEGYAGES
jgi:hypothetical protein